MPLVRADFNFNSMTLRTIEASAHLQEQLKRSMELRANEWETNHDGPTDQVRALREAARGNLDTAVLTLDTDPVRDHVNEDGLALVLCQFPEHPELESYYTFHVSDLPAADAAREGGLQF